MANGEYYQAGSSYDSFDFNSNKMGQFAPEEIEKIIRKMQGAGNKKMRKWVSKDEEEEFKMSYVDDLLRDLKSESLGSVEIVAPLLKNEKYVYNISYKGTSYPINNVERPGWYLVKLNPDKKVDIIRDASEEEKSHNLNKLVDLKAIVLSKSGDMEYLAFPEDINEAETKGFKAEPFRVFLVEGEHEQLSIIKVRQWGSVAIYDSKFSDASEVSKSLLKIKSEEIPDTLKVKKELRIAYSLIIY